MNENAKTFFNNGLKCFKSKDFKKAILFYSKAIEIEPDFFEAYFNRGLTKQNFNDCYGALLDITIAI